MKAFSLETDNLYEGRGLTGKMFRWEKQFRTKFVLERIMHDNVLDVGSRDGELASLLKNRGFKNVIAVDIEPKTPTVKRGDIENLPFKEKEFDTVICMHVLEHTKNPVKALLELRRVCAKQLFIAVPSEPFYSLFRFMMPCKEHLWTISPDVLKHYLGRPKEEKRIALGREYIAVWQDRSD